jgi:hypothetical protein
MGKLIQSLGFRRFDGNSSEAAGISGRVIGSVKMEDRILSRFVVLVAAVMTAGARLSRERDAELVVVAARGGALVFSGRRATV